MSEKRPRDTPAEKRPRLGRLVHFMTIWEDPNVSVLTFDRDSTPEGDVIYAELMKLWDVDDTDEDKEGYPKLRLEHTFARFVRPLLSGEQAENDSTIAFPEALLAVKNWGKWEYAKNSLRKAFHVYANVASLPQNTVAQRILDQHGLCAYTVTWEDTARDHNSAYGPNISDMTLIANGADMPVIRRPNFSDLTFKVSHALVTFTVGNELGEAKREITLKEFLMNPAHYLHEPLKYESDKPLWVDGADETVVMSAQACLLPVPLEDGKKTTFTPALRNHQSRKGAPAVLVIMATDEGTSVRVINTNRVEKLYFNLDGQRCPLKAMRLGAFRRAQGRPDDGSPMNAEERAKNRIMIVQVPLLVDFFKTSFSPATGKSNHPSVSFSGFAPSPFAPPPSSTHFTFGGSPPPPPKVKEESPESDDMGFDLFGDHPNDGAEVWTSDDPPPTPTPKVEHAIVSVGEPEGEYNELCGQKIVRDKRWPIRVTLQYYHATTTGTLDEALAQLIDQQLREAQAHYMAISVGSLVLHSVKPKLDTPPAWWPTFAQLHWEGELHKYYHSKEEAAAILFKNGRFTKEGMSRVADKALEILRKNATKK